MSSQKGLPWPLYSLNCFPWFCFSKPRHLPKADIWCIYLHVSLVSISPLLSAPWEQAPCPSALLTALPPVAATAPRAEIWVLRNAYWWVDEGVSEWINEGMFGSVNPFCPPQICLYAIPLVSHFLLASLSPFSLFYKLFPLRKTNKFLFLLLLFF